MRASWLLLFSFGVACGARSSLLLPETSETTPDPDPEPFCGDGTIDPGEACDDGNNVAGDGCEADCTLLSCGNGVVDPGEACDSPDPSICTPICTKPLCGDGILSPSEECDDGNDNGRLPSLVLIVNGEETPIQPIATFAPDAQFYNYFSASAHTGFEQPFRSTLFTYALRGSGGSLSLFSIHNIDLDSTGTMTGDGRAQQTFSGLPGGWFVSLADETNELSALSETDAFGDWTWHDNTDGGVLGGLPYPGEWTIEITSDFVQGIDTFQYADAVAGNLDLPLSETVTLRARLNGGKCTETCTLVRCGDGFVDAGEACDDGNTTSGDGCSSDCLRFD